MIRIIKAARRSLFVLSVLLFIYSLCTNNSDYTLISIGLIWIHNIIYTLEYVNRRIIFGAFNATFFLFLLGTTFISFLSGKGYSLRFQGERTILTTFAVLYFSLFFVFLGYSLLENRISKTLPVKSLNSDNYFSSDRIVMIRKISFVLFLLTAAAAFVVGFEKIAYVQNNSYLEYYTSFRSHLPSLVAKIADMNTMVLFMFLATMPSKKTSAIALSIFFLQGALSLGYGQRNGIMLNTVIIFIYIILRNEINPGKNKWFGKRAAFVCLLIIPLLAASLFFFRTGLEDKSFSIAGGGIDFINSQGISLNLIGYDINFRNMFPGNQLYSIGKLTYFLEHNIVTNLFVSFPVYPQNSAEMALYGTSFGQTLSYVVEPAKFLQGHGLGSCYIAEVFHDFGYLGVILWNFVIGMALALFYRFCFHNVVMTALALSMLKDLLYSPRAEAITFLTNSLNIVNVFTIILIVFIGWAIRNNGFVAKEDRYVPESRYIQQQLSL